MAVQSGIMELFAVLKRLNLYRNVLPIYKYVIILYNETVDFTNRKGRMFLEFDRFLSDRKRGTNYE